MWNPRQSAPAATMSRTSAAARSASTPKGEARPPIRIPDPRSSISGFTRTAIRGAMPSRAPIAKPRVASPSDSTFKVAPARIAAVSSSSRLPGPAKLIACAGSGKTEVVARRVVHLLTPGRADSLAPRNIVAFTFTEKAAAELKERIVTRTREALGELPGAKVKASGQKQAKGASSS